MYPESPPHLLVTAGAEGLPTLAGEDDHADGLIVPRVVQRPDHLLHRQRPEGVANLRAVDGDFRDAVGLVILDVGVLSRLGPFDRSHNQTSMLLLALYGHGRV